jgi:hypothetical protein
MCMHCSVPAHSCKLKHLVVMLKQLGQPIMLLHTLQ